MSLWTVAQAIPAPAPEHTLGGLVAENVVLLVLIVGVLAWMAMHYARSIARTRAFERSRRELAAYVAEGSIRPDEAVSILSAGTSEAEKAILDSVVWGMISPEKASRLIRELRTGAPAGGEEKGPAAAG